MQHEGKWYWSLKTHQVVPAGAEKLEDLLGPYDTADEAAGALDRIKARNEALEAEEEAEMSDEELEKKREREKFGGPFGF